MIFKVFEEASIVVWTTPRIADVVFSIHFQLPSASRQTHIAMGWSSTNVAFDIASQVIICIACMCVCDKGFVQVR